MKPTTQKRCIGWAVSRNGILIHCPDLVTRWNPRSMYHSTACAHRTLEWVKRGLVLGDRIVFLKACAHCGKKFKTRRPKQRFCSKRCRQANYLAANLEKTRAYKKAWNAANRPRKQPELKACALARCGKKFESSISWQRFCSEKCRDADHYKRHRIKIYARRKKWIAANPDKSRAAVRRHHAKHKDVLNAKSKARYAEKTRKLADTEAAVAAAQAKLAEAVADLAEAKLRKILGRKALWMQVGGNFLLDNPSAGNPEILAYLDKMRVPRRDKDLWAAVSNRPSLKNDLSDLRGLVGIRGRTFGRKL